MAQEMNEQEQKGFEKGYFAGWIEGYAKCGNRYKEIVLSWGWWRISKKDKQEIAKLIDDAINDNLLTQAAIKHLTGMCDLCPAYNECRLKSPNQIECYKVVRDYFERENKVSKVDQGCRF